MSLSNILQPDNKYVLFSDNVITNKINGIQGTLITESNNAGQVLKITSVENKTVAFSDIPSDLPDTSGFPNGYVLKIIDNTANTVNWEPDGTGATVPFILTGVDSNAFVIRADNINPPAIKIDTNLGLTTTSGNVRSTGTLICLGDNNVAKFQVANVSSQQLMRVDTIDNQVFLSANQNIVDGTDDVKKLGVYTNADDVNPIFQVSTENNNTGVTIAGQNNVEKFVIKNEIGNNVVAVDTATNDGIFTVGNNTQAQVNCVGSSGLVESKMINPAFIGLNGFSAQNVPNGTGLLMATSSNQVAPNRIASVGSVGTIITADNPITIAAPQIIFEESIPIIDAIASDYFDVKQLTNVAFVENRLGYFASARSDSTPLTNAQLVLTSILPPLNGSLNVPADYFTEGDAFTLVMAGSFACGNTQGITIQLKAVDGLMNTTILGSLTIAQGGLNSSTLSNYELEADILYRKVSSPTTQAEFVTSFDFTYLADGNTGFSGSRSVTQTNTLLLAQPQTLIVEAVFANSGQAASLTTKLLYLKKMH